MCASCKKKFNVCHSRIYRGRCSPFRTQTERIILRVLSLFILFFPREIKPKYWFSQLNVVRNIATNLVKNSAFNGII